MRLWPATRIYYLRDAIGALNSGLIFTSLWTFYYQTLQLTLIQVSLIFIIITVIGTLMEVPTGIIADVYSRRLSIILGGVFIGLCYTTAGLLPFYPVILIGAFLEAIGVRPALLIASIFLLPMIVLYFQNWRQGDRLAAAET